MFELTRISVVPATVHAPANIRGHAPRLCPAGSRRRIYRMFAHAWLIFPVLMLAALSRLAGAATAYVEGEALYRERILPPPGATLIVTLEDVSRADAKSTEIASARRLVAGGPPYGWRLAYDDGLAAAPKRLVLRARIVIGESLWMTTDTVVPLPDPAAGAAPSLRLVQVIRPATSPVVATSPVTPDCAAAVTQADMTRCAHEAFLSANQRYAERYAALATGLPAAQRDRLRQMQTSWIGYRTAACRFESGAAQGGSVQSQVYWLCAVRMTRERTEALGLLANCAEGDVACNRPAR
ncbi:MAG TPA: lysozyme inhibitor LprI family protein [Burkholderiales bacterium]|nr:lysozyme inhibitor LprI family protein [Burkholderiales bacterium]